MIVVMITTYYYPAWLLLFNLSSYKEPYSLAQVIK
jgi:hypothetical protein